MGTLARDVVFARLFFLSAFCAIHAFRSKGKSALKALTFLQVVRDKVHACYWYRLSMHLSTENSADYLQRVQIFLKPFIGEIFTYKKHPIHRNSSAMVINMDFLCQYIVTDIKQTCLGQGLELRLQFPQDNAHLR